MGNPNCCFMIIAVAFFCPANHRGELWLRAELLSWLKTKNIEKNLESWARIDLFDQKSVLFCLNLVENRSTCLNQASPFHIILRNLKISYFQGATLLKTIFSKTYHPFYFASIWPWSEIRVVMVPRNSSRKSLLKSSTIWLHDL